MKQTCCKCKIEKDISEFTKDKYKKSGYTYDCNICRAERQNIWKKNNPEKIKTVNNKNAKKRKEFYDSEEGKLCSRRAHLKRMYGITLEDYNEKLIEQNNKCKICNQENTFDRYGVLAVDHDHSTGKIRGLLCYKCNVGLGNFNDNKQLLEKAINYLKEYESTTSFTIGLVQDASSRNVPKEYYQTIL